VTILIECKPSSAELNVNHAAQLFRYFSVTDARLAVLTNGVNYQFYSDVEKPNKMDDRPFFTFSMDAIKPTDIKTLEKFAKGAFDIEKIVQEAGNLKTQSILRKEIEKEFAEPSDEFVRMMAARVHEGRVTPAVKENISRMLGPTIASIIRDLVTERISSALNASAPTPAEVVDPAVEPLEEGVVTTPEEISGFHIVQAIASKLVDPKHHHSRCEVLLCDPPRRQQQEDNRSSALQRHDNQVFWYVFRKRRAAKPDFGAYSNLSVCASNRSSPP
jgi:hypothetical protein